MKGAHVSDKMTRGEALAYVGSLLIFRENALARALGLRESPGWRRLLALVRSTVADAEFTREVRAARRRLHLDFCPMFDQRPAAAEAIAYVRDAAIRDGAGGDAGGRGCSCEAAWWNASAEDRERAIVAHGQGRRAFHAVVDRRHARRLAAYERRRAAGGARP